MCLDERTRHDTAWLSRYVGATVEERRFGLTHNNIHQCKRKCVKIWMYQRLDYVPFPHPQREIHPLLLRDQPSAKMSPGCSMLYHNEKRKENFQSLAGFGGFPAQVGAFFGEWKLWTLWRVSG